MNVLQYFPIIHFGTGCIMTGDTGGRILQFGIQQPILDRDYDRWNIYNEQYQRELSYAVYSKQPTLIRKVLEKYKVT